MESVSKTEFSGPAEDLWASRHGTGLESPLNCWRRWNERLCFMRRRCSQNPACREVSTVENDYSSGCWWKSPWMTWDGMSILKESEALRGSSCMPTWLQGRKEEIEAANPRSAAKILKREERKALFAFPCEGLIRVLCSIP